MKVGEKVVCIGSFYSGGRPIPVKGDIYTIEQIRPANHPVNKGRMYYILTGLDWIGADGERCQWETIGFRPIEPIGEVIADYIEKVHFKEYQFEETVRELQKWAGSGNG